MPAAPASLPLDHVDAWIFDLDNTLYPPEADIFAQIDERMGRFIADLLDCDRVAARRIQKDYFHTHGTPLSGLMTHHKVAPHDFLDFIHRTEEHTSELQSLMSINNAVFRFTTNHTHKHSI